MSEPPGPSGVGRFCCGYVACCAAGVPGAAWCVVGPGCFVCPWAAARPRAVRAACCCLWLRWCSGRRVVCCRAGLLCVPVGGGPPARSPHASLTARSGRSRGPPWPCRCPLAPQPGPPVPPVPSTPVGPGVLACGSARRLEARPGPEAVSAISHVIPLRIFQTMNSYRWGFNVSGPCCNFVQSNYVRLFWEW